MFRKLYNQATLEGTLEPDGPLLIVEGGAPVDPAAPDLAFVRTRRGSGYTVYLPGASLKGVLRAHAERLLATFLGPAAAESPFELGRATRRSQAKNARDHRETPGVYRLSCEADRLFGSTEIAGRCRIGDALPVDEASFTAANRTEVRYGVAIDRMKQSVKVGPFEQEAVTGGRFGFKVTLENFELWMLSLLLQVLSDLNAGLIQVGHAKSRGFGTVRVLEPQLSVRYPGARPERLEGAGAREASPERRSEYGLDGEDWVDLPPGAEKFAEGLMSGYRFEEWEGVGGVLNAVSNGPWSRFVSRAREDLENAS